MDAPCMNRSTSAEGLTSGHPSHPAAALPSTAAPVPKALRQPVHPHSQATATLPATPSPPAGSLAVSSNNNVIITAAAIHRRQVILCLLFFCAVFTHNLKASPTTLHSREMGATFLATLENGSPSMWRRVFRMTKPSFNALCTWLASNTMFSRSRNVSEREKLLIFLYIVCQGMPQNITAFLFGRSDETINRVFHEVLESVVMLAKAIIKLPGRFPSAYIKNNTKFFPFFQDCIGAIDGSHYGCQPSGSRTEVFRNRKGILSTNVLVAVDFDGRFIYMLAGWEGSAHDWKVYMDAVDKNFIVPNGKYLLADAGYNCSHRLLTPFRGIRYHLQETARHGLRPATPEELYNLRHSQARIIVEKAIGRHKSTFRIHTSRPAYPMATQVKVLYATAGLMNWIIDYGDRTAFSADEKLIPSQDQHPNALAGTQVTDEGQGFSAEEVIGGENGEMAIFRRKIAFNMWQQYKAYLEEQEGM